MNKYLKMIGFYLMILLIIILAVSFLNPMKSEVKDLTYSQLLNELAGKQVAEIKIDRGIDVVIKGLRNNRDFEYENNMEFFNKRMAKDIDTVYLMASHEHEYISSSAVRELLGFGGDISGLVPPEVEAALRLK